MNALKRTSILAVTVSILTGATANVTAGQQRPQSLPPVIVDNTRDVPAVVYLERDAFDTRLGTVGPHTRQAFALPPFVTIGSEVQVFVHPEGGMDMASTVFTEDPGQETVILVPASNVGYVSPPAPKTIPDAGIIGSTVTVQNSRMVPVTLFLEQGPFDVRIGTVPANAERTLPIPERFVNEDRTAELFIHPEGGVDLTSQIFDLRSDSHFLLKVPAK